MGQWRCGESAEVSDGIWTGLNPCADSACPSVETRRLRDELGLNSEPSEVLDATDIAGDVERRMKRGPDPPEPLEAGDFAEAGSPSSEDNELAAARFLAAIAAAVRAARAAFEFLRWVAGAGAAAACPSIAQERRMKTRHRSRSHGKPRKM